MNSKEYNSKLKALLEDSTKFKTIRKDPTDKLKKMLNALVTSVNAKVDGTKLHKLVGHYTPGYIYCNPKIHKSITDPPMRSIISQIGTVTYNISKTLNSIISKFLPTKYMVRSTAEFMELSRTVKSPRFLASLDVENLFTNVPVDATIEIILKNCYSHSTLSPPDIPSKTLEKLLKLCTTETPFKATDGSLYQQIDGVSMGSSLGPTFANFYIANLENKILPTIRDIEKCIYCRYVDDIFLVLPNFKLLETIKSQFETHSSLKFTYEVESNKKLAFLDTLIAREKQSLSTTVYTKKTSTGECINYNSVCPDRYKTGVVKHYCIEPI